MGRSWLEAKIAESPPWAETKILDGGWMARRLPDTLDYSCHF